MNLDDLLHKTPSRQWSPFQEAIFSSEPSLLIEAVAGSGKTTTIVEDMNRRKMLSIFLAFNKSIQQELASRVNGAAVKTLNALGHQVLMRKRPGCQLDAYKNSKRFRQVMDPEDYKHYGYQLSRAISLIKSYANFEPSVEDFESTMNELEIPSDLHREMAKICHRVFWEMEKNETLIDFDDQLYIPIKNGWTFPPYHLVYVDEAQDLSPIQHCMIQAICDRGAKLIAVGDRAQAIYGFRGAHSESMDLMKKQFSMKELPLSISYRCAQRIVAHAQRIVPHIQARPNAPEGLIEQAEQYPDLNFYKPDDLIICRNNAPIFKLALQFIRERKNCRVMSNFLDTMKNFINQFDATSSHDLKIKLDQWYEKEKKEAELNERWGKLGIIQDKWEVVSEFCELYKTTEEILSTIERLATSQYGPRISTIHRAKGLEAPTVFMLRADLIGARAESPMQIAAEKNLEYVAITRARDNLVYLPVESFNG